MKMNTPAVRRFASEIYDEVYKERSDVEFYREVANRYSTLRILECGCGTGRVTIPLADDGHTVDAIDTSLPRLEVLQAKLAICPPQVSDRIQFILGDMRTISMPTRYDLIIMPFRTFQHLLTVEDQVLCIQNLRRHMAPAGRILLDMFNPSIPFLASTNLGEFWQESLIFLDDETTCRVLQQVYARDFVTQTQDCEERFEVTRGHSSDPEIFSWRYTARYTFRWELEHLVVRCGLEVEAVWGDFDFSDFGLKYPGEILMLIREP